MSTPNYRIVSIKEKRNKKDPTYWTRHGVAYINENSISLDLESVPVPLERKLFLVPFKKDNEPDSNETETGSVKKDTQNGILN